MLTLHPTTVRFDATPWPDVVRIAVERSTPRLVLDRADAGPHPTFADAPEVTTTITVTSDVPRGDPAAPIPGDRGLLAFVSAPAATSAARHHACTAVVTRVAYASSPRSGAVRTVELVALSSDGAADPISTTPAEHA